MTRKHQAMLWRLGSVLMVAVPMGLLMSLGQKAVHTALDYWAFWVPALFAVQILVVVKAKRVEAMAPDPRACWKCGYSREGLDWRTACPECGAGLRTP